MLPILALLAVSPEAVATEGPPARDFGDVFEEVCTLGQGSFAPGTINSIDWQALPPSLRKHLSKGGAANWGRYHTILEGEDKAFLALEDRIPSKGDPQRVCSLASKAIEVDAMVAKLGGDALSSLREEHPFLKRSRALGFQTKSSLGYTIKIERLRDGYVLLQSSMASGSETSSDSQSTESDGSK